MSERRHEIKKGRKQEGKGKEKKGKGKIKKGGSKRKDRIRENFMGIGVLGKWN